MSSFRCVVDASVGIKLLIDEPLSDRADALLGQLGTDPSAELYVPDLFYVECANILWKLARRGTCSAQDAGRCLAQLEALALLPVPTKEVVNEALAIAVRYDLTAYDATYVALSQVEQAPLWTADERLLRKLDGSSYAVRWLGDFPLPT